YSCRLEEDGEDERAPAFYGFVFDESGHAQVAMHFDDEDGVDLAEYLLTSISEAPADLANPSVLSDSCIVTGALLEEDASLGLLYRNEVAVEVSGWQFFTGTESPESLNDADNLSMCPVAFVAELFPDIIRYLNAEIGSEYTRTADGLTRSK
ncbi:MAG: hypothetical protein ACI8W8_001761, partial [Rhodothermales bacterium]